MSSQYLVAVEPSYASFGSASSAGFDTCHLYAAKSRMSAHDEFILYDLRGWIVSFCTLSISRASSSWSKTWQRSMTMLSWIFCQRWARKIWMSDILSVGILPCMKMPVRSSCTC